MIGILNSPFRLGISAVKVVTYASALAIFAASIFMLNSADELRLLNQFEALERVSPLPRAEALAAAGRYCEALDYLNAFMEYEYVRRDPAVMALYAEIEAERASYAFRIQDIWRGVWKGQGACPESLISATVTDFLIVGDFRDLIWEGVNTYCGREADEFTMALAGVGILLSGATYVATPATAGGAAPAGVTARVSLSLLKAAKKMGKLPRALQKALIRVFRKAVKLRSLKPLEPLTSSLYKISRVKGIRVADVMAVTARSRNIKDIKFMEKVVAAFGSKTRKYLRLAGNTSVDVLRRYGKTPNLNRALDKAIQYGPQGGRLLRKTGPTAFLRYLRIAKYSTRAVRSFHKDRLTMTAAHLSKMLPSGALWGMAVVSGLIVLGVPFRVLYTRFRTMRIPGARVRT
jgi:hypothetical protein